MLKNTPIAPNIQRTLHKKMAMLEAGSAKIIGLDEDSGNWLSMFTAETKPQNKAINYMYSRSPYIRVTSLTPVNEDEPIILTGGELNKLGELKGDFLSHLQNGMAGKYSTTNYVDYPDDPTATGTLEKREMPFRPIPGVKDISVEFKGGGMNLGATRECQINWVCWSWEELERLTGHFLSIKRGVLVEWGWSGIGELLTNNLYPLLERDKDTNIIKFKKDSINGLGFKILPWISSKDGNYDAMVGIVNNFNWSVNEQGGFDCTTTLVAQGVSMFQSQQQGSEQAKFESMPLIGRVSGNSQKYKQLEDKLGSGGLFDTAEGWKETLKNRIPYVTFREYMSDFPFQLSSLYENNPRQPVWRVKDVEFKEMGWKYPGNIDLSSTICTHGRKVYDNHFCSWGWFEDNVLSRFFGQATSTGDVLCEFRSFTTGRAPNGSLGTVGGNIGPSVSHRMKWNKFILTIDTTKWLIPNKNDPIFEYLNWYMADDTYQKDPISKIAYNDTSTSMAMRDVVFNARYLSEKMKGSTDLLKSVLDVWNDFSKTYGSMYKFKIEFDELDSRLSLIEEGFTDEKITVGKQLDNLRKKERGEKHESPKLFVFPTMEQGSIVKSQTINAKLPSRFQIAAMYGSSNLPKSEEQKSKNYEDMVGKLYGRINKEKPKDTTGLTEEQKKQMTYRDKLVGDISVPSFKNRDFGRNDASIHKQLYIGPASDDPNLAKHQENGMAKGTRIAPSILDDMDNAQSHYLQKRKSNNAGAKDSDTVDDEGKLKAFNKIVADFNDNFFKSENNKKSEKAMFYEFDTEEETEFWSEEDEEMVSEDSDPDTEAIQEQTEFANVANDQKGKNENSALWNVSNDGVGGFGNPLSDDFWNQLGSDWHGSEEEINRNQNERMNDTGQLFVDYIGDDGKTFTTLPITEKDQDIQTEAGVTRKEWNGKAYGEKITTSFRGTLSLKPELLFELQKKIRDDREVGLAQTIEPLIPIDFEMELDGTGGIHPGNSFHSSYLSTRYKEDASFVATGVNHTIDSNGWTTTLKGQIKARALKDEPVVGEVEEEDNELKFMDVDIDFEEEVCGEGYEKNDDGECVPIPVPEEPPLELASTYEGTYIQNSTILYKEPHKPEWRPPPQGSKNESFFDEAPTAAVSKENRQAYWDEHIEAPTPGGVSKLPK
tara:strand:+ start:244 stop:3729 length:3486 start_codon:yes stop_codon:yes gene_type:complete